MADDEGEIEDYMSDAFLLGAAGSEPKPTTYSRKREKRLEKQKVKGYTKPLHEREKETREAGLSKAIAEENKGFKMLEKMGFRKGMTLGQQTTESSTIGAPLLAEPIQIALKTDRQGLGMAEFGRKRTRELLEAAQDGERLTEQQYRDLQNRRFAERVLLSDLKNSRKACEDLDCKDPDGEQRQEFWSLAETEADSSHETASDGSETHVLPEFELLEVYLILFFAYGVINPELAETDTTFFFPWPTQPVMQLREVTKYLRSRHSYCIWCGCRFSTPEELSQVCPGDTRDAHEDS
ncbi:G patch domain-containing protein 11 [Quaeritorhiza haematococci]|nr:G patch domain-containing protein 11 [Quaeritorhiza haematococci]